MPREATLSRLCFSGGGGKVSRGETPARDSFHLNDEARLLLIMLLIAAQIKKVPKAAGFIVFGRDLWPCQYRKLAW